MHLVWEFRSQSLVGILFFDLLACFLLQFLAFPILNSAVSQGKPTLFTLWRLLWELTYGRAAGDDSEKEYAFAGRWERIRWAWFFAGDGRLV